VVLSLPGLIPLGRCGFLYRALFFFDIPFFLVYDWWFLFAELWSFFALGGAYIVGLGGGWGGFVVRVFGCFGIRRFVSNLLVFVCFCVLVFMAQFLGFFFGDFFGE